MTLTYFYDGQCGLCANLRRFFEREELRIPVEVVDLHSAQALLAECPLDPRAEVLATDGHGRWWQGADAWIMALWCSERFAEWSLRLAEPDLRPLAQRFASAVSRRRHAISGLLGMRPDRVGTADLDQLPDFPEVCELAGGTRPPRQPRSRAMQP